MQFDPLQSRALDAVNDWLHDPYRKPWFYLAGYAGTGKTTIAKHFAEGQGLVYFAAYTGKAAQVMKSKGCKNATTIHRLIYSYRGANFKGRQEIEQKMHELRMELRAELNDPDDWFEAMPNTPKAKEILGQLELLQAELEAQTKRAEDTGSAELVFDKKVMLERPKLLILDECSMIDEVMRDDLLEFKIPILVLGDPAQLPPVKGTGAFTSQKPDFLLTEVHRQAAGNPVLDLATKVRCGEQLKPGVYGESTVCRAGQIQHKDLLASDMVLVGMNKTRKRWNRTARELLGYESSFPQDGDRLISLKNHHKLYIYNGTLMRAMADAETEEIYQGIEDLAIKVDIDNGADEQDQRILSFCTQAFNQYDNPEYFDIRDQRTRVQQQVLDVDYAYALTVHKSQGSQWDGVTIVDDGFGLWGQNTDPDMRKQWLYTAITRAAERVTIGLHPRACSMARVLPAWPRKG